MTGSMKAIPVGQLMTLTDSSGDAIATIRVSETTQTIEIILKSPKTLVFVKSE